MTNTDLAAQDLQSFLKAHPNVEVFEMILPDLNGRLRGKWLDRDKITKILERGVKLPLSTLAFDVWGRDPESWVFATGDVDGYCVPSLSSFSLVPWASRPMAQFLVSLNSTDDLPCSYDPRHILEHQIKALERHGLTAVLATELEFYLLKKGEGSIPEHTQTDLGGTIAIGGQTYGIDAMQEMEALLHAIREACSIQLLPIDTLITEAAPSQYEINLHHQKDALIAADQGLLLQRAIKAVAQQQQLIASFMAKPFADLAGNGMHMHCSLIDQNGVNVFDNGSATGSEILRYAVAGCLASMIDCSLLFAPHFNSYKRLQAHSHAPTSVSWGYDNRTASLRIPAGKPEAMRIEHRVAGADGNPYLVASAILAGMLYGIENKLEAPAPISGDVYLQDVSSIPSHWNGALESFSNSNFIRKYFGVEFQKIYAATKQQEISEFQRHISLLEYQSYLL